MPVFSYTAIDSVSHRVRGVIRADSPRQARAVLLRQGIRTTELVPGGTESKPTAHRPLAGITMRMLALRQREQVSDAFENLLTLLESHVPLEEAWESIMQERGGKRRHRWRERRVPPVLHQLHEGVRQGRPMWGVMEGFGQHFDAADVALIRAGEESGELAAALARFVARRQMAGKLLSTFAGALAYPTFLMIFGSAVVVFLTTAVLPHLTAMLVAAGGQVPWPTRVLMIAGRVISLGILPALFAVVLAVGLFQRRSLRVRRYCVAKALRVPIIGAAWHHWQLAQFCLVLRTLVASGVHLPVALVLAGRATGEGPVADAALALRDHLLEGHDLDGTAESVPNLDNDAAVDGGARMEEGFPPWLWRALAVGQATGDLVPVLERVGQRFETSASRSAARVASVLEPAMILGIGAVVGLIAYGAMLPIVRLGGAL